MNDAFERLLLNKKGTFLSRLCYGDFRCRVFKSSLQIDSMAIDKSEEESCSGNESFLDADRVFQRAYFYVEYKLFRQG
jgi:hypothetical protein